MEFADLARWTPTRLDFSTPHPTVVWADMASERFLEPFFDQTVARWSTGPRARAPVRTGLSALLALDTQPSLDPAGMIFHLSRCGSTLASRLLSTMPGVVVISEPSPLNALLGLDPDRVDGATLVQVVRLLVRALGRRRHGNERQLVLKCTSWNVRRQEILTAAFPGTPWVWIQRDPAEVMTSLLAGPPDWLGQPAPTAQSARRFGIDPVELPTMARTEFTGRALGAMLLSASVGPQPRMCIDYSQLPAAVWEIVAPHFGIEIDTEAIRRMAEQSRFHSKEVDPQIFPGFGAGPLAVAADVADAAERFAGPGYRRLADAL